MEININKVFFKDIEMAELKVYIKELKAERDYLRSRINPYIENTIFDNGINIELNYKIYELSKKIVYLSTGLMLKTLGRI